jgi:hypothetical protein
MSKRAPDKQIHRAKERSLATMRAQAHLVDTKSLPPYPGVALVAQAWHSQTRSV